MKKKDALLFLMLAAALGGIIAEATRTNSSVATAATNAPPPAAPQRAMKAGDTFEIDAADLRPKLIASTEDERPEQIADWVVYATLLYARVPSGELRNSLYDRPPLRLPLLEESVNFDYGPGRRVVLSDKSVWLFRSTTDAHPAATLARLADQVRMELGYKPERFSVFTYRSTLTDGVIQVRKEPDITASSMYSPEYGYVEAKVGNLAEFKKWLAQIDDVVHAHKLGDNVIELGGRRMSDARTEGVSLEHVASLYQGHRRIAENHAAFDPEQRGKALMDAVNANISHANVGGDIDQLGFTTAAGGFAGMLDRWADALEQHGYDTAALRLSPLAIVEARSVESQKEIYELAASHANAMLPMLHEAGLIMPSEPGFSLDPLWNGAGLVRDLERLLQEPQSLVGEAAAVMKNSPRHHVDETSNIVWAAFEVAAADEPLQISAARRQQITAAIEAMRGKSDRSLPAGPIVPLLNLQHELKEAAGEDALTGLVEYIVSKNRCQCARYDGPMQGTLVGMNLFYTDLLAKLWASVDYRHTAPETEVVGFRSSLRILPNIERAFWKEMMDKPNTRLWFGPKKEGYARSQDSSEVNFAHVATRVYSAGSDERKPGAEEEPSEHSRQVFHWWDRHFERVADYEQQYHTQNQIMKWSVITGWAAENHLLDFLDTPSIPIQRNLRFDRWYPANESLRFRGDVRLLPESFWRGGTECMEILRSYPVPSAGSFKYIEGGVSLGGVRTLSEEGAAVAERAAPALRRAGLTVEENGGAIRNFKATEFELPADLTRTVIKPKVGNFLRDGATEFRVAKFETELIGGGNTRGALSVTADGEELASLTFQQTERGVKLAFREAPGSYAKEMTEFAAKVNGKELPPLVNRNVYFIESKNGAVDAIARSADDVQARTFVITSDGPQKGLVQAGYGAHGEHRVSASAIDAAAASQRLESQAWQRLTVAEEGSAARVFTSNSPRPGATPVKIKSAAGAEIDAYVDRQGVWLRRPQSYEHFESFVDREEITPAFLKGVLQTKKAGSVIATPAASTPSGIRAAAAAGDGDLTEAMAELTAAAKQGNFDKALRDFDARFGNESLRDLTGARPRLSYDYTSVKGTDADAFIRRGLIAARENNLPRAADDLTHVLGMKPSDTMLRSVASIPDSSDLAVVRDLVTATDHGATPAFMKQVKIGAEKFRLHTSVDIDQAGVRVMPVLDKAGAQRLVSDTESVFYVDRRLLAQYDWDGAPGNSLHRALSDPNVVWEEVSMDGAGEFRPSMLTQEQKAFVSMQVTHPGKTVPHFSGEHVLRLRYRPCEPNDPRSDCANAA